MKFHFLYLFTFILAALLTFGCGGGSDPDTEPDSDPELTILVQPPGEGPFPGGIFLGGQNVMLTATVSHANGPNLEATQLQLYLSQDAAISTDDLPQGEMQPVEALMSGASANVNVTVTLPPMTGSYHYGACITLADSREICSSGALIMVSKSAMTVTPDSMSARTLGVGVSHYFRFTLESAQRSAFYTSGLTNVTGSLYDDNGMLLATDEDSGDEVNFRIESPLAPDTYFIRVNGADTSVTGDYTLHVEKGAHVTTVRPASVTNRSLVAGFSDYFQFTLASAQSLVIHTSGGISTSGILYDGRGVLLAEDEDSGGGDNFRIEPERPLQAGTYFLRVSGNDFGIVGTYTLHIISVVTPASTVNGILIAGGTDHFQFTLAGAQSLAIYTRGDIDVTGNLLGSDGTLLATDENGGGEGNFRIDRPLAAGTYFIQVTGADMSVQGGYTLHLELPDITTVQLDSTTEASLAAGASDYFQFTLPGTGTLESSQLLAIYTSGEGNLTGRLYDGDGTFLTTDEDSGGGGNFRINRSLAAGTYLIEVSGADISVTGG